MFSIFSKKTSPRKTSASRGSSKRVKSEPAKLTCESATNSRYIKRMVWYQDMDRHERAFSLLQQVASLVYPVIKAYHITIGSFTESLDEKSWGACCPNNARWSHPELTVRKILLRVRRVSDPTRFRDLSTCVNTMLHELAHAHLHGRGIQDDHGPRWRKVNQAMIDAFWKYNDAKTIPSLTLYVKGTASQPDTTEERSYVLRDAQRAATRAAAKGEPQQIEAMATQQAYCRRHLAGSSVEEDLDRQQQYGGQASVEEVPNSQQQYDRWASVEEDVNSRQQHETLPSNPRSFYEDLEECAEY